MTDKNRLFLMTLILVQTACTTLNPVRTTTAHKHAQSLSNSAPVTHSESGIYKNEPIKVEEVPVAKQADSSVEKGKVYENKPHPLLSPAAQSLLAGAEKNTKAGDLDSASVMLERALRISPRNAELTYQLAALRLKQSQPRLAEDLGKKAVLLSAQDRELKKRCWQLIVQARELQGNAQGAKEAQLKVDSLE